jgi:hypothetical protein
MALDAAEWAPSTTSFTSILARPRHGRYSPDSDKIADVPGGPVGAKTGREQVQQCEAKITQ